MKMKMNKKYDDGMVKGSLEELNKSYRIDIIDYRLVSEDEYDDGIPLYKNHLSKKKYDGKTAKSFFKRKMNKYFKKMKAI